MTEAEKEWLATNHPKLLAIVSGNRLVLQGVLEFHRTFNELPIEDSYRIRLEILAGEKPKLTETGGRIRAVYDDRPRLKTPADIHAYPSWKLCYAAPQEIVLKYLPTPNIRRLIEDHIEPYLYSQSFFEKFDRWPWPHLPHNTKGIVEWYVDNHELEGALRETAREIHRLARKGYVDAKNIIAKAKRYDSFVPTSKCLCGSGRPYVRCHRQLPKLALALRNA